MMKPPIQIALPSDHPALKGCLPGDVLMVKVKTLPGEEGEEADSEAEPEGEAQIMADVQSITKVKAVPAKPKAAPIKPMDYLKSKQTGKKAEAY